MTRDKLCPQSEAEEAKKDSRTEYLVQETGPMGIQRNERVIAHREEMLIRYAPPNI